MKINYANINPSIFGNYTSRMRPITGLRTVSRMKGFCKMMVM